MAELPIAQFADAAAWRAWLAENAATSDGVRLMIAKKGSEHSSPSYAEALDEALCVGWIDGRKNSLDGDHFLQSFGPRRARSLWSKINRDKVAALVEQGRMQPAGQAAVDRAKADGRWDAAYGGSASIDVPDELTAALAESPDAAALFARLNSQNRYAILFRLANVKRAETRTRNIEKFVAMLERGETIYPQKGLGV